MRDAPETPLPRLQLMVVALIQVTESWNVNVVFPFAVFMIRDFGVVSTSVGYYSGLLAGSFCLGQFISSAAWGSLSDTVVSRTARKHRVGASLWLCNQLAHGNHGKVQLWVA